MVEGKECKCQFLHFTKLRYHLCNCSSTLFGKYCSTNMKLLLKRPLQILPALTPDPWTHTPKRTLKCVSSCCNSCVIFLFLWAAETSLIASFISAVRAQQHLFNTLLISHCLLNNCSFYLYSHIVLLLKIVSLKCCVFKQLPCPAISCI